MEFPGDARLFVAISGPLKGAKPAADPGGAAYDKVYGKPRMDAGRKPLEAS